MGRDDGGTIVEDIICVFVDVTENFGNKVILTIASIWIWLPSHLSEQNVDLPCQSLTKAHIVAHQQHEHLQYFDIDRIQMVLGNHVTNILLLVYFKNILVPHTVRLEWFLTKF